jgi:hypothetical protein
VYEEKEVAPVPDSHKAKVLIQVIDALLEKEENTVGSALANLVVEMDSLKKCGRG